MTDYSNQPYQTPPTKPNSNMALASMILWHPGLDHTPRPGIHCRHHHRAHGEEGDQGQHGPTRRRRSGNCRTCYGICQYCNRFMRLSRHGGNDGFRTVHPLP